MNKKKYECSVLEIIEFSTEDVIVTSDTNGAKFPEDDELPIAKEQTI